MNKLSVLVFCKNFDIEPLIKSVCNISDDIVIIDASDKFFVKKIYDLKKKFKNIRVFHGVSIGHLEPLMVYGLNKCRYEWVLRIDADELLNEKLLQDINFLVNDNVAAYRIKRRNTINEFSTYDYVTRLFRKSATKFRGILHEYPHISGLVRTLDDTYLFYHYPKKINNFHYNSKPKKEKKYHEALFYEFRLNYYIFRDQIENMLQNKYLVKIFEKVVFLYLKLRGKKLDDEFSKIDYYFVFLLDSIASIFRMRSFNMAIVRFIYYMSLVKELFSFPDEERKEQMEISKKIRQYGGVINFLNLDKESVIKDINRKYKNKIEGIDLFIELLRKRNRET